MKFQTTFTRIKGGGGTALGDALPTAAPRTTIDNVMSLDPYNENGWPVHRIAVGFSTIAAVAQIRADVFLFDEASASWFRLNQEPKYLIPGVLTYFDIVSPCARRLGPQAMDIYLRTFDDASVPNGTYVFAATPDLTTIGSDEPDISAPARRVRAVTPNDAADLPDGPCRSLFVTVAGNVAIIAKDDSAAVTIAVGAGQVLPVEVRRVNATNTTATAIALY